MRRPPRIGVIGSGAATDAQMRLAREVGAAIARLGGVTICGGLGGVMHAAAEGAASESGAVVGILPGDVAEAAAPGVSIPLPTGLGQARNVLVVKASEAVIAIGGEWGTLSEAALCRKFGIPLIGLEASLPDGVVDEVAREAAEAARRAVRLADAERRSRS